MSDGAARSSAPGRRWLLLLALLALPVLTVGLFGRTLYTPDEPREAALSVAMAVQAERAVPELGGRYFLEKPPLLYWLAGAAARVFDVTPPSLRGPGLLYAGLAIAAIALLAAQAAGRTAGFVAGAVTATALILYRVEIWLATDAPLLAGVALALFGIHRALSSEERRVRLQGYLCLQLGLTLSFFAKNFAGWMVPVLALLVVLLWERRWRELITMEFWAFAPLTALAILLWVGAVARLPDGHQALKVLFWHNLIGRALPVSSAGPYAYTTGHVNFPGKYLLELPAYLLPWTALAVASLGAAPNATAQGPDRLAWRLAIAAIVPSTLLLSVAATARDIYYAPTALGFALLTGLWAAKASYARPGHRLALQLTALLIALLSLTVAALAVLLTFAPREDGAAGARVLALAAPVSAIALLVAGLRRARLAPAPGDAGPALTAFALATVVTLSVGLLPVYRTLDGWMDLQALAARFGAAAGHHPLIVLDPDETTEAMLSMYLPEVVGVVRRGDSEAASALKSHLAATPEARVLYLVPDSGHWSLRAWLGFLGYGGPAPQPPSVRLPEGLPPFTVESLLTRAGGRTYAILSPAAPEARLPMKPE